MNRRDESALRGQEMDPAQALRKLLRLDLADLYRHQSFVEAPNLAQLPIAPLRGDAIRRHEPDHGIGAANEIGQLVLPLLAIGQVAPVDRDLKIFAFKRGDKRVGRSHVAARIGNEKLEPVAHKWTPVGGPPGPVSGWKRGASTLLIPRSRPHVSFGQRDCVSTNEAVLVRPPLATCNPATRA
jgi:hypothetical protein